MEMTELNSTVEANRESGVLGKHHTSNMVSDRQVGINNVVTTSIEMISVGNSMIEFSARSSSSMMDSIRPQISDQPVNRQSFFFSDVSALHSHACWRPNLNLGGGKLLPDVPRVFQQSFYNFPADSEFTDRAARFTNVDGGNFREMMSSFSFPDSQSPYSGGFASIQRPHETFEANGLKKMDRLQTHGYEVNLAEGSKEASLPVEQNKEVNSIESEKKSQGFLWFHDEMKYGADGDQVNNSDSLEKLEGVDCKSVELSKKSKRISQNIDPGEIREVPQPLIETEKGHAQIKQKSGLYPTSMSKPANKHGKQGSQGSDTPKEDYIHVRARRGQATNSHSLAERVRREKISERMKYLQDLVPGCSKVTGKAVMLDEIINYVQSLQRQVEFLSMKLATVDPLFDINVHSILSKNILRPRTCMSSSLVFPSDTMIPPYPLPHPGLLLSGISGLGNSSDTLQRPINLQSTIVRGGYKELQSSPVPTIWEDELHSVVQMGFNPTSSIKKQDSGDPAPHDKDP